MTWKIDNPQGAESLKIRHMIVPYTRGKGLDLGPGPWKAWPHFIGIDDYSEYNGLKWRPDILGDCTDLSMFANLDFVFSSHLLEHLDDTEAVLREWWRVIKPGGHLVLYLPHKDLYPNIGEPGSNPDHKHDFLPDDIIEIMEGIGSWDLVENQRRGEREEYSFFQVYRKLKGTRHRQSWRNKPTEKRCLVVRYGGFGDQIQASSILPHLKEEGWHITFQTTPRGQSIVREDPHIDEFWIQDVDQVPNEELGEYWEALSYEFDRCINLSESVECTLLPPPGRRQHALSHAARHRLMDVNYFEFTHLMADVPMDFRPKFYPSAQEKIAAQKYRADIGPVPLIMCVLQGTSNHKIWPHTDILVNWLIKDTNAKILLVGDKGSQMLEFGIAQTLVKEFLGVEYEDSAQRKLSELLTDLKAHFGSNRILCRSGSLSIRDTMAMLEHCDLIFGPETGVLNAACMLDVPKVVMLSHSSHENLTKHWVNTVVLESRGCPESPCHRLHYTWEFCHRAENGAALCADAISPEEVYSAIRTLIPDKVAA